MEKILVIQTAFIGDALLTLPMIQKIKEIFSGSVVDVIANPRTAAIFSASPHVDKVIILDKRGEHKSFFSLLKYASEIRKSGYTRLYSPHRSIRTAVLVMQSQVKETFGFSNSSLKHVYNNLVEYSYSRHEVQRNLDLVGYNYTGEDWRILPELKIDEEAQLKIGSFIKENNLYGNIAAIAPGSVWKTKRYPAEHFKKIIRYFLDSNFKVVLIGSSDDFPLCEELKGGNNLNVVSAAGVFSIIETAGFLKNCSILLCNDSAPTHLGVCADIPVLTLYCSTISDFGFYPYNKKSSYLSFDDLFCKPCGIHGYQECPVKTFACGYNLRPETVIGRIQEML